MSNDTMQESNLVAHARRELATIGEDKAHAESLIEMVKIFAKQGHSGGSAPIAIAQLTALLNFENLSPLTDDPEEWYFHGEETWGAKGGIWQNKRNGEAFSQDGGKTYYLLSESSHNFAKRPYHESRYHKPCEVCGATVPHMHSPRCKNNPVNSTN